MASAATIARGAAMAPVRAAAWAIGRATGTADAEERVERIVEKLTLRRFCTALVALIVVLTAVTAVVSPDAVFAIPDETGQDPGLGVDPLTYNSETSATDPRELYEEVKDSDDPLMRFLLAPLTVMTDINISTARAFVSQTADSSILTASFSSINPGIYSVVQGVHKTAVVPIANVIALIVFTIGLVKVFANSSSVEAGIDLWKILLIFICYGATLIVINTSWEIMVALYSLAVKLISAVGGSMAAVPAASSVSNAAAKDVGMALFTSLFSFIALLAVIISCLLINVMILARGVEIYLYACYSPVAFAFMVTEGGRQMTEAFLKRYAAILLAGAIQMVLLMVFAMSVANIGDPGTFSDSKGLVDWTAKYVTSFIWVFVCAYMMKKSTTLAKDIVGTN